MAGVEGQGPFLPAALYQVSCRLLGCRLANMQPGSRPYAWLFLYWIRGVLWVGGGGGGADSVVLRALVAVSEYSRHRGHGTFITYFHSNANPVELGATSATMTPKKMKLVNEFMKPGMTIHRPVRHQSTSNGSAGGAYIGLDEGSSSSF